jgi:hypothetical protein
MATTGTLAHLPPARLSTGNAGWAVGWGGQRLYVFPDLDLVLAQHCGNYDKPGTEQRRINDAIITEIVLPSFV